MINWFYIPLRSLLENIILPKQVYQAEFLEGIEEALIDDKVERIDAVKSFEEFVK